MTRHHHHHKGNAMTKAQPLGPSLTDGGPGDQREPAKVEPANTLHKDACDIANAIDQMPVNVRADAKRCAESEDWMGLVYIANVATGRSGNASLSLGVVCDLITIFRQYR